MENVQYPFSPYDFSPDNALLFHAETQFPRKSCGINCVVHPSRVVTIPSLGKKGQGHRRSAPGGSRGSVTTAGALLLWPWPPLVKGAKQCNPRPQGSERGVAQWSAGKRRPVPFARLLRLATSSSHLHAQKSFLLVIYRPLAGLLVAQVVRKRHPFHTRFDRIVRGKPKKKGFLSLYPYA